MKEKLTIIMDELNAAAKSGNLPRPLTTTAEVFCVAGCINAMLRGETATFIQSTIRDYFSRHGLQVKEKGIGWEVAA